MGRGQLQGTSIDVFKLWAGLKPDWNFLKRLLCCRWSCSWAATTFPGAWTGMEVGDGPVVGKDFQVRVSSLRRGVMERGQPGRTGWWLVWSEDLWNGCWLWSGLWGREPRHRWKSRSRDTWGSYLWVDKEYIFMCIENISCLPSLGYLYVFNINVYMHLLICACILGNGLNPDMIHIYCLKKLTALHKCLWHLLCDGALGVRKKDGHSWSWKTHSLRLPASVQPGAPVSHHSRRAHREESTGSRKSVAVMILQSTASPEKSPKWNEQLKTMRRQFVLNEARTLQLCLWGHVICWIWYKIAGMGCSCNLT